MSAGKTSILVKGLSYTYPQGPGNRQVKAIDNVSFSVDPGEFVLLTGPSGCGKTTLCRCLAGLIPHVESGILKGDIFINGVNTRQMRPCDISALLALTFQNPDDQIFSNSVEAELVFGPENIGLSQTEIDERIASAAETMGISRLKSHLVDELSGGERQRVAIASSMTLYPGAIVMDEPTSALDPSGAFGLVESLHKISSQGQKTVIVIEHRLERFLGVADRMIVMNAGRIAFDGTPDQVLHNDPGSIGVHEPPAVTLQKRYGGLNGSWCARFKEPGSTLKKCTLSIRDVSLAYRRRKANALENISLDFYSGEIAFIMGANGSGKTTLAKCMNRLLVPDAGEVLVNGVDIAGIRVAAVSRNVGLIFQNPDHQLFAETVYDELAFGLKNAAMSPESIDRAVRNIAGALGLSDVLNESPFLLSGGQKQRVAIGSVLTIEPSVIVLDEPTIGLDYGLKEALASILNTIKNSGKTVIVITHDVEFAAAHAERLIVLSGGRVIRDSSPRDALTDPEFVRSAALHLPQATELGLSLGLSNVLSVDEFSKVENDGHT